MSLAQLKSLLKIFTILTIQFCFISAVADTLPRSGKTISRAYGFSGTLFDMALYYSQTEATATPAAGNSWESSTSIYDIKLGYITEGQIYFGALYNIRSDNQISTNANSGSSAGIGLGYFGYNGFNLRAYYKLNEYYGDYKDGTGYQIDLGYAINPTSSFYLGLNISMRNTIYKMNSTIPGFQSWDRKETYPFITLGFLYF